MKTGEGGFVHRTMPPVDYDFGPIPAECYDKTLTCGQINNMLVAIYSEPERLLALAESDDPAELMRATIVVEIVAEIDAQTVYGHNQSV